MASTPVDPAVLAAMMGLYASPGNPSAEEHSFGWTARSHVERARGHVAVLVGSDADEVVFTSGASEANNIAVLGAARAAPSERRRVLVSAIEHKSVLGPAHALAGEGYVVEVLPVDRAGVVDMDVVRKRVDRDVAVLAVMAVNNEIGAVQPIEQVAALGRRVGAFVHVDATQAPATGAVSLHDWGADSLSISGHKISGPAGVGALALASGAPWRPKPIAFGGGQEGGLRPGSLPTALCVGLGVACDLIARGGAIERARVSGLSDRFLNGLRRLDVRFAHTTGVAPRHPGCLHLRFPGIDGADLLSRLQPRVAASTGSACTSGVMRTSSVLGAIGMTQRDASECVRFSLGRATTVDEIDFAVELIARELRKGEAP